MYGGACMQGQLSWARQGVEPGTKPRWVDVMQTLLSNAHSCIPLSMSQATEGWICVLPSLLGHPDAC